MELFIGFVVFCQMLGALIGAGATIAGEFSYLRAIRAGHHPTHAERAHLKTLAAGLRFGMGLLLLASATLVVTAYLSNAAVQPAQTSSYWAFILVALVVIYATWARSRDKVSFALGSAILFTGWWFLAYFSLGLIPAFSLGALVAFFVVAVLVFYFILQYARILAHPKA